MWGHEMKFTNFVAALIVTGALGVGAAQAQIAETQPAEFPPASYKGKQYVDSKGCVFIRAGIDGDVSWIPRVTRARKVVCGFKPSLSAEVAAAAAPQTAAPAEEPVQITVNTTPAVAPTPAPVAKPVAQVKAQPAKPKVVRKKILRKPAVPQKVVVAQVAPEPAPAPVVQPTTQIIVRNGVVVPQAPKTRALPLKYPKGTPSVLPQAPVGASRTDYVTDTTRIVPKHVAQNRVNTQNVSVPRGYKAAWNDGRLNPKRAEQNLRGRGQMLLIWTQTLPRRLIDQNTGRDVTASVPLVYPYTSVAQQRANLGEVKIVQRNGQILKHVVRNPGVAPLKRQPVYSTRSTPAAAQPKVAKAKPSQDKVRASGGKRFVQVGTYRNPQNAQRAAQTISRMGMQARIGKYRKSGQTYMSVQAGPFQQVSALNSAVTQLRRAGYHDAFPRK